MAAERTLVLIKPDAMRRGLAGEILRRFEARGLELREAKLLTVDARACRGALRGACGEAVLRRARRVHHVGADPGARAGRGGGDRDRPHDDGRDEPSRRRRPERFAAISRCRCRTTSSTAPTRRSRPRARSRSGLTDYLERNRAVWTKANEEYTDARAREAWAAEEITWGMFGPSESELGVLGDVAGKDVIELGCGTALLRGMARNGAGARVTGVDLTPAQLETARRMSEETGIAMELLEANAEDVPLPDESFDLASRSTARRSGATRTSGFRRRRGCCGPAASSSSSATRLWPCSALRTRARWASSSSGRSSACIASSGPTMTRASSSTSSHGEMLRLLRESGFEVEGALGDPGERDARRTTATTTSSRPSGHGSGRPRRSGRPASAGERPAGAADHPRFALAPAARDPRAARTFRSSSFRRSTKSTAAIPLEVVSGGEGALRRGRTRPAGARRRHRGRRRRRGAREAGGRGRGGGDARATRRPNARSRLGSLSPTLRAGRSSHRETTRVTFRPLTARDLAHYVGKRRVGGPRRRLRDPGPRRLAGRAPRGRLPQRRRPPGSPSRPPPGRALPGHVRLRLNEPCPVSEAGQVLDGRWSAIEGRARSHRRSCSKASQRGARRDRLERG